MNDIEVTYDLTRSKLIGQFEKKGGRVPVWYQKFFTIKDRNRHLSFPSCVIYSVKRKTWALFIYFPKGLYQNAYIGILLFEIS